MSDESVRAMLAREAEEAEQVAEAEDRAATRDETFTGDVIDVGYLSLPADLQQQLEEVKTCPTCKQISWEDLSTVPTVEGGSS